MMSRKGTVKLIAGVCALGMAVCGLLLSKMPSQQPAEEDISALSTIEDQSGSESSEEEIFLREQGLTVVCPQMSTAADAFLLIAPDCTVLIDTGEDVSAEAVLSAMEEYHVTELDALILTHFDRDHIGGVAAVMDNVMVKRIYRTAFSANNERYEAFLASIWQHPLTEVITLKKTETLKLGSAVFTIYPTLEKDFEKDRQNNSSIITSVIWKEGEHSLLFMGDAVKARVKEFLASQYDGTEYEILKVPHHGRDLKQLKKLFESFIPVHALISSSQDEPEDPELLQELEAEGVNAWLTREGAVTIFCDEKGINVTQKDE